MNPFKVEQKHGRGMKVWAPDSLNKLYAAHQDVAPSVMDTAQHRRTDLYILWYWPVNKDSSR